MKILFLAHRIPYPPNKGDKIRSCHELRAMVERGHEVHLLAFADDVNDLKHQVELARWCASVGIVRLRPGLATLRGGANLMTTRPLSLGYFSSRAMRRAAGLAARAHDFDAAFVYSSTMAQYVPRGLESRTVVDLVDVDSEKWRDYATRVHPLMSWVYGLESKRLRRYEYDVVSRFARTVLTTNREAALLDQLDEFTRRAGIKVITNGVDLDYFRPAGDGVIEPHPPRLVFTGAMDYYANVEGARWFVEEVFPLIRARTPRAEFFIVGRKPAREVKRMGEREGVRVTGFVEDVRPYLDDATAVVVPLRIARGVQNKLLEAMAAGKAVVATSEAVAGLQLDHTDREQLLVADTPQTFAGAAIEVIDDQRLRANLGRAARRFVEARHDWDPLLQKLVELVELVEAVGARSNSGQGRGIRAATKNW